MRIRDVRNRWETQNSLSFRGISLGLAITSARLSLLSPAAVLESADEGGCDVGGGTDWL